MKSIKLNITYKSGTTLEQVVNYVHVENNKLYFTVKKQIQNAIEPPVIVQLENIPSFDIEETEQLFNH